MTLTIGSLYALIALGYTMVYGILKLINFAHSDVVVLGAWVSLTSASFLLPRLGVNLDSPPWWAGTMVLVLSMVICGLVGLMIERLAYKPIRRSPRLNALITAMGVSLLLQNAGQLQYTLKSGITELTHGTIVERDSDPKKLKLDQPLTLAKDGHYLLQITSVTAPGTPPATPIERIITAAPGQYAAGDPINIADTIGKSQARGASYTLITRSTALKLPFGKMPDRVPNLMPNVTATHEASAVNVLWEHDFVSQQTQPDGTVRTLIKPLKIELVQVVIVGTAFILMIGLQLLIYHTRLGMAMRAVSFNTDYAALMGIPIDRVISTTFVIGAVLAAAAGFLYGQKYGQLQQTAHYTWTLLGLKAFIAAVVGGIGNIRGAVVGGFLIAFIEQFGGLYGTYVFPSASAYTDVVVFVLLIVVLLVKPSGLFGSTVREKV